MNHVGELASAYLDGETTPKEASRLVAHLADCDACQREMADLHAARSVVRSLPVLELPESIRVDLGLSPDVVPFRSRPAAWVGTAAAAVMIFVAVATAAAPDSVGLTLVEVSAQYEQQALVDGGVSPVVGLVRAGGGE
ncbi:MAG: anti-sigma factor [Acidimicrobiia bacterium]|nr:anti-sigma factor [Acidimicrobiia bacterium]MDH5502927.1 anti-sigma factor [Acidimicrobiia bacterium]